MMNNMIAKITDDKKWIRLSVFSFVVPCVIFSFFGILLGGEEEYLKLFGAMSGITVLMSLGGVLLSGIAFIKLRGWKKIAPVLSTLLLAVLMVAAVFNYYLSGV